MTTSPRFRYLLVLPFVQWLLCTPLCGQSSRYFFYAPNTAQITFLSDKHDGSLGIGYGRGGRNTVFEAQAVYSPVRYGAVMVNFMSSGKKTIRNSPGSGTEFSFGEIGVGLYKDWEHGSASVFAGVGQGRLRNDYGDDQYSRFTVRRWFLQPAVSYTGKNFRGGISLRLSRLSYPRGATSFNIGPELDVIKKIDKEAPFFLPEPAITGGLILRPFIFSINLTAVFPDADGLLFSRTNVNIMLSFDLGEFYRMRKEKDAKRITPSF